MIKLNLGIVADEISRNFREAVRIGTSLGIRRYEVRFLQTGRAPMCERNELMEIDRIRDGEGIEITALSPGLFKHTSRREDFDRELGNVLPRSIEWALRWQLPALIIFGFHRAGVTEDIADTVLDDKIPPEIPQWLAKAGEMAQADGLKLLIEAEPICWADTGTSTLRMIRESQSEAIGINYDPANIAWKMRADPIDELESIAPLIDNVHVKDLIEAPRGSGIPVWAVPGEGMLDYVAHFAALKKWGYEGPVSLEPHLEASPQTIAACKEAVESIWAQAEKE